MLNKLEQILIIISIERDQGKQLLLGHGRWPLSPLPARASVRPGFVVLCLHLPFGSWSLFSMWSLSCQFLPHMVSGAASSLRGAVRSILWLLRWAAQAACGSEPGPPACPLHWEDTCPEPGEPRGARRKFALFQNLQRDAVHSSCQKRKSLLLFCKSFRSS